MPLLVVLLGTVQVEAAILPTALLDALELFKVLRQACNIDEKYDVNYQHAVENAGKTKS